MFKANHYLKVVHTFLWSSKVATSFNQTLFENSITYIKFEWSLSIRHNKLCMPIL